MPRWNEKGRALGQWQPRVQSPRPGREQGEGGRRFQRLQCLAGELARRAEGARPGLATQGIGLLLPRSLNALVPRSFPGEQPQG